MATALPALARASAAPVLFSSVEDMMSGRNTMKLEAIAGLALVALLFSASGPRAQGITTSEHDTARIEKFKAVVLDGVETRRKLAQVMNDTVFSFGELAYQE